MKVATVFGRRSEIIRLSQVIKLLDQHSEHILIHTGASFDESLSDLHINGLDLRAPDVDLRGSGQDLAVAIASVAPDRVLTGCSAPNVGRPVFYFGSSDEISFADVALVFTRSARERAIFNGFDPGRVMVVGDPCKEVLETFAEQIEESKVLKVLSIRPFDYFLATVHRSDNTSNADRLSRIVGSLATVARKFNKPVLFVVHPDTARQMEAFQIKGDPLVRLLRSMSFFDFVKLEKNALAVLTDSMGVQDECCVLGAPVVTLVSRTTRSETIACGSNIVAGPEPVAMTQAVELAIAQPALWEVPADYNTPNVSQIVGRIVLSEAFSK